MARTSSKRSKTQSQTPSGASGGKRGARRARGGSKPRIPSGSVAPSPTLTLSPSRDIPFESLRLSQANVRRIKAEVSIDYLAADIARRGLIQSLNVRPILNADGVETGLYEVPAGGRRFRALELLVKQGTLDGSAPIPCVVRDADTDILPEDDSLAENVQREALHPLDQFRAFQSLREKGRSEEAIAAAFFVPVTVVRQRLKLASVSPRLLDTYAEDGIRLEQVMAFTVTDDHKRQEKVWEALSKSYSKEPYDIRRLLTEKAVKANDKRVRFIGMEAYVAAGGAVSRDLFQEDHGGWCEDVALVERLVTDKLRTEAEAIVREGWKWIDAAPAFDYGHTNGLRRLKGEETPLTDEEETQRDALQTEFDELTAEHEDVDELPDAVDARFGELEQLLETFEQRPLRFEPADIARAGAFVSIGHDGRLMVERGFVRPEDEAPAGESTDGESNGAGDASGNGHGASNGSGGGRTGLTMPGDAADAEDDDDAIKPLPERLVLELTAHRTLALREAVARNSDVALTLLLHKLVSDTFRHSSSGHCLEATVRHVFFNVQPPGLKETPPAVSLQQMRDGWQQDLPADDQALWDWLAGLDAASRLALLAHCVAYGVNAVQEKVDRYGATMPHRQSERIRLADRVARAVGLDMVEAGWRPTVEAYLGRVTKPRILEAVREALGEEKAQLIDHLKKAEMAKEAERLLADTGWLPEVLRTQDEAADNASPVGNGAAEDDGQAAPDLPAFLTGDGEEGDDADADDGGPGRGYDHLPDADSPVDEATRPPMAAE
jgi:ParB family transcriptional regulator, chromosome partitioning protein